jgi:hypothetical protein
VVEDPNGRTVGFHSKKAIIEGRKNVIPIRQPARIDPDGSKGPTRTSCSFKFLGLAVIRLIWVPHEAYLQTLEPSVSLLACSIVGSHASAALERYVCHFRPLEPP